MNRIILSPGTYPVELKNAGYEEVIIEGLYGNPWSEKEDSEKTILTQPKDKDQPLFITYGDCTLKVGINSKFYRLSARNQVSNLF